MKQELENYERYAQTTEGEKRIHESFKSKLEQIDSAGPFIEQLTSMYQQFCTETISNEERAIIGVPYYISFYQQTLSPIIFFRLAI